MNPTPAYQVIQAWHHEKLAKEVTEYLQGGWALHGPLIVIGDDGHNTRYIQAVVYTPKPARTRAKKTEAE